MWTLFLERRKAGKRNLARDDVDEKINADDVTGPTRLDDSLRNSFSSEDKREQHSNSPTKKFKHFKNGGFFFSILLWEIEFWDVISSLFGGRRAELEQRREKGRGS